MPKANSKSGHDDGNGDGNGDGGHEPPNEADETEVGTNGSEATEAGPADEGVEADDARPRRAMGDSVRKVLRSGLRSVLSSEEGIKSAVSDAIPRELIGYVMRQVDTGRDELVKVFGNQLKRFLDNVDIGGELQKILTSVSFEVRMEVRFIPNDQSVRPDSKIGVKIKSARGETGDKADRNERGSTSFMRAGLKRALAEAVDRALASRGREHEHEPEDEIAPPEVEPEVTEPEKGS